MRKILYSLLLLLLIVPSAVQARRYTVVVSLDGFRRDYVQIYDTPFLNRMARKGVQATMQPSFPSVTFPNHYTPQQYLPDELKDTHYYEYGPNKTEQAAKRYWEEIKGRKL